MGQLARRGGLAAGDIDQSQALLEEGVFDFAGFGGFGNEGAGGARGVLREEDRDGLTVW